MAEPEHQRNASASSDGGTCFTVSWARLETPLCAVLSSLGVLALISWTVAPSITFGDSPELVAAAHDLGLAHPPGYPLWTILNHVAIRVSGAPNPALVVNFMSALCLALAGLFSFIAYRQVSGHSLIALVMAWAVCLTPVVWDQGTMAEVYALDLALLAASIAVALALHGRLGRGEPMQPWVALGLGALMMAAVVHRTSNAVLLIGCLPMFLHAPRPLWLRAKTLIPFSMGVLLSALVWAYIPIRGGPWWNLPVTPDGGSTVYPPGFGLGQVYTQAAIWGPSEWLNHIAAKAYRDALWRGTPRIWGTLAMGNAYMISHELNSVVWVLALIGGALGWRSTGIRSVPFYWVAIADLLLFWNYWVYDREVFLIPFYWGACGLAAVGLAAPTRWLHGHQGALARPLAAWGLAAAVAVTVVIPVPRTLRQLDRRGDTMADQLVQSMLGAMPDERAWLIGGEPRVTPDHLYHAILYYGHVIGAYMPALLVRVTQSPADGGTEARPSRGLEVFMAQQMTQTEAERWTASTAEEERYAVLVDMALRTGTIYAPVGYGGDHEEWLVAGGGWPYCRVWTTCVLSKPWDQRQEAPELYRLHVAQAYQWAEQCLSVRPGDPIHSGMAFAPLMELIDERVVYGDTEEGLRLLDEAEVLDPGNLFLALERAWLLNVLERHEEAVRVLQDARPRSVSRLGLWQPMSLRLGWTLWHLGRCEEAAEVLEQATAVRNAPLEGFRLPLMDCYVQLGRMDDALRVAQPIMDLVRDMDRAAREGHPDHGRGRMPNIDEPVPAL